MTLATPARANGRFPAAGHVVVGPGARDEAVVVRGTLGLFVSRDRGTSFSWVCEEALGYSGVWDPPVVLAGAGTLVGLPDGLTRGADDCAFVRVAEAGTGAVLDLAASPDGARVVAAVDLRGEALVLRSSDGGRSFATTRVGLAGATLTTLDVAPSRPDRVWAVARLADAASLLRSDDGGARFTVAQPRLPGVAAYLSAVHPSDPDVLWLRVAGDGRTTLWQSRDGGATWRMRLEVTGAMEGFALAADGRRVWAGGAAAGLWHSRDGGDFARVDDAPVLCLRHHAGALYVCTDHTRDGVSLARLRDGASAREALLRYRDVEPTPDCPGSAPVSSSCAALWRNVRAGVLRDAAVDAPLDARADVERDAASEVIDAGVDVSADARGADVTTDVTADVKVAMDAAGATSVTSSGGRCGCRAAGRGAGTSWAWLLAVCAAAGLRRRCAPRSRPSLRSTACR